MNSTIFIISHDVNPGRQFYMFTLGIVDNAQ